MMSNLQSKVQGQLGNPLASGLEISYQAQPFGGIQEGSQYSPVISDSNMQIGDFQAALLDMSPSERQQLFASVGL